jgi:hypothetical protein
MTLWGSTLFVEVSSAEPDADPVWVDISDRVIIPSGVELDALLGRSTELAGIDPGSGGLLLRNEDDRFTPGNPTSPYYPWWKQARRIRVREVFGHQAYDLGDGYLEIPENVVTAQQVDGPIKIIKMTVRWVDVLGRFQNARKFGALLTEYIKFNAGPSLVAHWPMTETAGPFRSITGPAMPTVSEPYVLRWGDQTAQSSAALLTPAATAGPRGDDGQYPQYDMEVHTVSGFLRPARSISTYATVPHGTMEVTAGQVMTTVFWVRSSWSATDSEASPFLIRYFSFPTDGVITLVRQDGGTWLLEVTGGTSASFATTADAPTDRWTLIGIRWGFTPNTVELWVDDVQTVGTLSFVPVGDARIDDFYMPEGRFDGSIAQVQVYIGDAEDYTFEMFQAQRRVGLEGFDRQTTGERINTVLDYAGFPAGRRDIDPGTAVMQPLQLAGKRPLQPLEEAVDTERGRLFAAGGRVKFHDRIRVHNV